MSARSEGEVYGKEAPRYENAGYPTVPNALGQKRPPSREWQQSLKWTASQRLRRNQKYSNCNLGLLAGSLLSTGNRFAFVDVDVDGLTSFVDAIFDSKAPAKKGAKGATFFCQAIEGIKSRKLKRQGTAAPAVEVFASSGQTVIPPSRHPNGSNYRWIGRELLSVAHEELPVLDDVKLQIIEMVVGNRHTWEIIEGGADVKAHQAMLSLASCGVANLVEDLDWLAACLNTLLPKGYHGNTAAETLGMLKSAKKKGLGRSIRRANYNPGNDGPIGLGFTRDGSYALHDRVRNIVITASAQQLLSQQFLLGLAPSAFWATQYPAKKAKFDAFSAGEALIAVCKSRGSFNPQKVRGRGVWREGDRLIINFGGELPPDLKHLYLCFEPIEFAPADKFDTQRLLALLQMFNWRNPQDAMLKLGWLALAPICGVLNWRPHIFVYGPPRCGKTTLHSLASTLLHPLVLSTDGQSSEAGVRQTLGADSLPIIIDEFESDQSGASLRGILRLARSASSAESPVLRGTPEGKAMQFSLRTTFMFSAVNPGRMSPADQTRIMMMELLPHNNDSAVAKTIANEEAFFRSLGPQWCGYMVSLAPLIEASIRELEGVMPSADRRHRENFATLLAGAFVALHGRVPSSVEAQAWADEYRESVDRHSEEIERDNSKECLDRLLAFEIEHFPLQHWIAVALQDSGEGREYFDAVRIMRLYDIVVRGNASEKPGVLIRNGAPNIEKLFEGTVWEGRAWERALRALEGAFVERDPVWFAGSHKKSRCIGIPIDFIGDPIVTRPDPADDFKPF